MRHGKYLNPCELTLDTFTKLVMKALGSENPYLSHCDGDRQTCLLQ